MIYMSYLNRLSLNYESPKLHADFKIFCTTKLGMICHNVTIKELPTLSKAKSKLPMGQIMKHQYHNKDNK